MDYCVQLGFDNVNAPQLDGYGVDHEKVVTGLGCKFVRVYKQAEIAPAIQQAEKWMTEFQVPVVIEVMLERVTNIAMGTEIDKINEFEEIDCRHPEGRREFGVAQRRGLCEVRIAAAASAAERRPADIPSPPTTSHGSSAGSRDGSAAAQRPPRTPRRCGPRSRR